MVVNSLQPSQASILLSGFMIFDINISKSLMTDGLIMSYLLSVVFKFKLTQSKRIYILFAYSMEIMFLFSLQQRDTELRRILFAYDLRIMFCGS